MLGILSLPRMSVDPGGSRQPPALTQRTGTRVMPSSRHWKTTSLAVRQIAVLVTKCRKPTISHIHYFLLERGLENT